MWLENQVMSFRLLDEVGEYVGKVTTEYLVRKTKGLSRDCLVSDVPHYVAAPI